MTNPFAFGRPLSWCALGPGRAVLGAYEMPIRIRTWHPGFWLVAARLAWGMIRLEIRLWRWTFIIGGGPKE